MNRTQFKGCSHEVIEVPTCREQPVKCSSSPPWQHPELVVVECWEQKQRHDLDDEIKWIICFWGTFQCTSPFPARLPPNPPAPRMKTVIWFSNITLPLCLSLVSMMVVTAAALPLSSTSISLNEITWGGFLALVVSSKLPTYRTSLISSPDVGIGPLILKYCSPWSSLA